MSNKFEEILFKYITFIVSFNLPKMFLFIYVYIVIVLFYFLPFGLEWTFGLHQITVD